MSSEQGWLWTPCRAKPWTLPNPWRAKSLRFCIALELLVLGLLTAIFLLAFPQRTVLVDISLALFAWALLGLNAGYTKDVIWARRPEADSVRRRAALRLMWLTVSAMALFLLVGAFIGYQSGGWGSAYHRIFRGQILLAFPLYLLWAFLQQTLFQFYLLGRLRRLFPLVPPLLLCAFNGLGFAFVHWPQPLLMALTAVAGTLWSYSYYHHGRLWPIALSHAALGSTFYYWIHGYDLASGWISLVLR